jgi:hypothetical protein
MVIMIAREDKVVDAVLLRANPRVEGSNPSWVGSTRLIPYFGLLK